MPTISTQRPRVEVSERLYTAADLAAMPLALPSGPVRYELDDGRLLTLCPPASDHCALELKLAAILFNEGERRGIGKVRCGNVKIVLWRDPDRIVVTDAVFIARRSLPISETPEGHLETIPTLVVEALHANDSKEYLDRKIADYLKAGVEQVWIVNPFETTLTVHRNDTEPQTFGEHDTLRCDDCLSGLELRLDEIFAD